MPRLLALGISIGLITGFVQSLGLTLQRKAQSLTYSVQEGNTKTMWRIGFTIFILANLLGSTVQIAALPLTILAPLHACGLVYNAVLATLMLGEPFTWLAWVGTILVAIGATLIGIFGAITEPSHTLEQLLHLFEAPRFLGWMSFQLVLALGIVISVSIASRTAGGKTPQSRLVQGAALGCLAGIMASHCLLLAKLTVELLVKTFGDGINQFNHWQAWAILVGLIAGALSQLYYLNRGLRMCTTSILYPLNFSIYNITTILDGLIYYKQAAELTALQIGLVILGVVLLLLGVAGLSWRFRSEDEDDP
ncbi:magnesium transporter, partial [Protomyces lactucae-debilis]